MKTILLSALVFLVAVSCQQKQTEQPAGQVPSGHADVMAEERMLRDVVAKDPRNGEAWIKLGNILMDTSRFGEAIDAYQKALDIDPKNVDVRVDMGICYRNTGRAEIAVKEFRKGIEINPSHLMAHKNLAIVLAYDTKDNAGAIKEFEKTLQLAPAAPDAGQIKAEIEKLKAPKK